MPDCQEAVYSNEYADYIVEVERDQREWITEGLCYENIEDLLSILHIPRTDALPELWEAYRSYPKCYGLLDTSNLEAIGVERVRRQPFVDLYGQGIILGIVDTGIDYTHPAFRYGDGSSRILDLWDQSIPYEPGKTGYAQEHYGTAYSREDITRALQSEDPYEQVPSRDQNGHGTFLAGVAAGNQMEQEGFSGVAPLADIAVVKLKEAKPYLREYYQIPEGVPCYQETDLILGVLHLLHLAAREGKPLVILLALGTNQGGHSGSSYLAAVLRANHQIQGRCICLAAGNEAGTGRHYRGFLPEQEEEQELEFRVGKPGGSGQPGQGFVMELWAESPDVYAVGFTTPAGYRTGRIPVRQGRIERLTVAFEPVEIEVAYEVVVRGTGYRLTGIRLLDPTPGLWKMQVYREDVLSGRYDIWMPMEQFLPVETYFIQPDPDTTICDPGNVLESITAAAYDHRNGSIYLRSSRGYTRLGGIKPDIVAPGVDITGPVPGGRYENRSGTSVAAAQTAGVAALLLEYQPNSSGRDLQQYLLQGARRMNRSYPNPEWGYGILDLYRTIEIIGGK